jgi:hypothetical protein
MSSLNNCPHCNANLVGDEIPANIRHHYGSATNWRREIGLVNPHKYDGVWEWKCPDCLGTWDSEIKKLKEK